MTPAEDSPAFSSPSPPIPPRETPSTAIRSASPDSTPYSSSTNFPLVLAVESGKALSSRDDSNTRMGRSWEVGSGFGSKRRKIGLSIVRAS